MDRSPLGWRNTEQQPRGGGRKEVVRAGLTLPEIKVLHTKPAPHTIPLALVHPPGPKYWDAFLFRPLPRNEIVHMPLLEATQLFPTALLHQPLRKPLAGNIVNVLAGHPMERTTRQKVLSVRLKIDMVVRSRLLSRLLRHT